MTHPVDNQYQYGVVYNLDGQIVGFNLSPDVYISLTDGEIEKVLEAYAKQKHEQEQKTGTWSIKDVADTLAKHGLIAEQEPCEDTISRQVVLDYINRILNQGMGKKKSFKFIHKFVEKLPSVNPQEPKTDYISIDDVMSVFDDFMRGEVDEEGTETFLEMLKDKVESEG